MGAIKNDNLLIRKAAFDQAKVFVDDLVNRHGLKEQNQTYAAFHISRINAVDQHLEAVIRLADWLLEENQDA